MLSPTTGQAVAGEQGVTKAGVPPGQKAPTGQAVPAALVEPAAHPNPGVAVQGPEQAGLARPEVLPKTPTGQGAQTEEPEAE